MGIVAFELPKLYFEIEVPAEAGWQPPPGDKMAFLNEAYAHEYAAAHGYVIYRVVQVGS